MRIASAFIACELRVERVGAFGVVKLLCLEIIFLNVIKSSKEFLYPSIVFLSIL